MRVKRTQMKRFLGGSRPPRERDGEILLIQVSIRMAPLIPISFVPQSSKYGSKRDYERESSSRSSSSYLRDRDANTASPLMGSHSMNGGGGGGSYSRRSSLSPDMDVSPRDHRDRDSRYSSSSSSYTQKMRDKDRDRDVYKKDKYLGKWRGLALNLYS